MRNRREQRQRMRRQRSIGLRVSRTPRIVVAALNAMHASSVAMYADLKADIGAVDDRISEFFDDLESYDVLPPAEATG